MNRSYPYVQPLRVPPEEFPPDTSLPEGVEELHPDPSFGFSVDYIHDLVYAVRGDLPLHIQLLIPYDHAANSGFPPSKRLMRKQSAHQGPPPPEPKGKATFPLVVYVPGSAFHKQNVYEWIPYLVDVARRGFVVACVEYRPSECAPYPALVEDVKDAIRFLRRDAADYCIEPEHVAIWGNSSGGYAALYCGLTGDREPASDLYPDVSSQVGCIVDFYGPTAFDRMNEVLTGEDHYGADSPEGCYLGNVSIPEHLELARQASPLYRLDEGELPPVLMMHGGRDGLVAFHQSVLLYQALKERGCDVTLYKLPEAIHDSSLFRTPEILDLVERFIRSRLGC